MHKDTGELIGFDTDLEAEEFFSIRKHKEDYIKVDSKFLSIEELRNKQVKNPTLKELYIRLDASKDAPRAVRRRIEKQIRKAHNA